MPGNEVIGHLAGTTVFSLLTPAELSDLASLFELAEYAPGQVLAREGEMDASLWVIVSGGVALDRRTTGGAVKHVGYRGYGGIVGERGVFAGLRRNTSAVTLQPSTLLHADRDALWRHLEDDDGLFDRLVLSDEVRQRLALPGAGAARLGERPIAVYRRHWSSFVRSLTLPIAAVAISLFAAGAVASFANRTSVIVGLAILGLAIPVGVTVWSFLDYWYDLLIVTTRRVVHIDRTPFIRSRRAEAPLDRVQDIVVLTPSLPARLLGYGTLVVQTAGTLGAIRFEMCPGPESVRQIIFEESEHAGSAARRERQDRILTRLESVVLADGDAAPMPGVEDDPADAPLPGPVPPEALMSAGSLLTRWLPKTRLEADGCVVWRKHWWVLVRRTALLLASIAAMLLGMMHTRMGGPVPQAFWAAGAAVLTAWLIYRYEDWRNDLYILSDEHIVDIERRPFGMFGERRQARLNQIQDIRYRVPNPLATLLDYGDVHIETAAETGRFTFDQVHDPAGVQEEIFARLEMLRSRVERVEEERRADEMANWFREYHRIAGTGRLPES
jgi:CRP-like cAMP-binding protein